MESKQPAILAVLIVSFSLATFCLILRLSSRCIKKAAFWWDDFFAISCYLFAVAWLVDIPIWLSRGLGLHISDLSGVTVSEATSQSKLCNYVAELIYACALYCAKMSILAFYWRLFGHTNVRIPIMVLAAASTVWWIIRLFLGIFRCTPPRAFWDLTIKDAKCNSVDQKFFYAIVATHLVLDILILILPVLKISKLNLGKVQRMGVIAMFMFGILVCAAASGVIAATVKFDPTNVDLTWNITDFAIWATVEINLVAVSACFPTIGPAFRYIFGRFLPQSTNKSSSKGYGSHLPNGATNLKSIKLSTVTKSRLHDEEGSTYQLADSVHGNNSTKGGFEAHALDRRTGNTRTVITGNDSDETLSELKEGYTGGIAVKRETEVSVTDASD